MIEKKYLDVIEDNGWSVYEDGNDVDISQYSPAGEDFSFSVYADNLVDDVAEYAESFDAEEHAAMWYEAGKRGARDVPSLRVLIDDADDIQEMLDDLSKQLAAI